MTFQPPEGEPVHITCFRAGGACLRAGEAWYWCGSARKTGWHEGHENEGHAQYFVSVEQALRFARGRGWIGE